MSANFSERYYNHMQNAQSEKYDQLKNITATSSNQLSIQECEFIWAVLKQSIDELILINIKSLETPPKDLPINQNIDQMIAIKFEEDVEFIRKTLFDTKQQIFENGNFNVLLEKIGNHIQIARDEYQLILEFITNNNLCKQLMDQTKLNKENGRSKVKQLNEHIATLQSQICDYKIQNQMKCSLVQKWEQTRHEQAKIILDEEETKLVDTHRLYNCHIEREQVAVTEIETFIKHKINVLEGMISHWQQKYKCDVTDLDKHIKETKDCISDVQIKIDNIKERHAERKKFIDQYREEQRILMEKRKYEEKQRNSAVTIQSWWRGVMVRKQLGPYRPKKKNKKGGKGGKKK